MADDSKSVKSATSHETKVEVVVDQQTYQADLKEAVVAQQDEAKPINPPKSAMTTKFSTSLRFAAQRLPGLILIGGAALLFIGPLYVPILYWIVVMFMHVCLVTNAVRMALGLVTTAIKTKKHIEIDWMAKYRSVVASRDQPPTVNHEEVRHVIIIPNYKEDFDTLCETLDTLAHHYQASSAYKVVLAMEQGEKGCEAKAEKLIIQFGHRFQSMRYTVHPSGIEGEARGKSSNVAWAATFYHQHWMEASDARKEIVTVMDADTHLTSKYFECITFRYCVANDEQQTRMLFAPSLIFDRNSNSVPFVVRLADICWSIGLMSNFQLVVKFPCSVYTLSMLLVQRVGFWDAGPEAIGEDMHMALKCWTQTGMNLIATPIYVPASCSCVQADTYVGSVNARYQQSVRHLWGALDFGYAFSSITLEGNWYKAPFKSLLCMYLLFEIFFQPYFGFYHMSGQFIFPSSIKSGVGAAVIEYTTYIRLALIPPALIVAFAYERYHYLACHYRATILASVKAKMAADEAVDGVELGSPVNSPQLEKRYEQSQISFRKWYQVADWAGLIFCLFAYYLVPGINAMILQMFTNKLDYKVSLKPTTRQAAGDLPGSASQTTLVVVEDKGSSTAQMNSSDSIDVKIASSAKRRSHQVRDSGVEVITAVA